jgi:hypothetical protein
VTGFGRAAGLGERPAVVVVDLIRGFTDPGCPLGADLGDVVAATRALLDVARDRGVPVWFTTTCYDDDRAAQAAVFLRKVPALRTLRPGSEWVDVDERLARRDDEEVLVKSFASAFFDTALAERLRARDSLVVCGASTSGSRRSSGARRSATAGRRRTPSPCPTSSRSTATSWRSTTCGHGSMADLVVCDVGPRDGLQNHAAAVAPATLGEELPGLVHRAG